MRKSAAGSLAVAGLITPGLGLAVAAGSDTGHAERVGQSSPTGVFDSDSLERYLMSRHIADSGLADMLRDSDLVALRGEFLRYGIVASDAPASTMEADRIVGLYLTRRGDPAGPRILLNSKIAAPDEIREAFVNLTPDSVRVNSEDVAAAEGLTPRGADVAVRYAYLQGLAELTGHAASQLLPTFNTYALSSSPDGSPILELRVKQSDVKQAREILDLSAALAEVEVVGVERSADEVHALYRVVEAALTERGVEADQYALTTDGTFQSIVIHPTTGDLDLDSLVADSSSLAGLAAADAVRVGDRIEPFQDEATMMGGPKAAGSGSYYCTWGFYAQNNGNDVFLTAEHCRNSLKHSGVWMGVVSGTAYNDGDYADVQAHRVPSGHTTIAAVDRSSGSNLDVESLTFYNDIPLWGGVCKEGANTGWSCGQIVDKTASGTHFVRVDRAPHPGQNNYAHGGGDSGGPYMHGNAAYGIHHSGSGTTGTFTATDYAMWFSHSTIQTK